MQELYSHQHSPIHKLDARVKVIFTLAFLIFLNLLPHNAWAAFLLFLTVTLSLALLSRLGIAFVMKRSLLALPFLLAALPLVFSGPPPHIPLLRWQDFEITYSQVGLERLLGIAFKSWISVQAAILLSATTRLPDLLTALQQLKVPRLFVAVIGLMGRYLSVIRDEAVRLMRGRSSRSGSSSRSAAMPGSKHKGSTLFFRARVTGGMVGSLFLRSLDRSDRVFAAMLSRGYTGELPLDQNVLIPAREKKLLYFGISLLVCLWLLGLLTAS